MNKKDSRFGIHVLGDYNTGKTSLIVQFTERFFKLNPPLPCIGFDFKYHTVEIEGNEIKLQIFDMVKIYSGKEKQIFHFSKKILSRHYVLCDSF